MALPTTNLTLHLDASSNGTLFKTFVSGGPNTGVPVDDDIIEVWEDFQGINQIGKQFAPNNLPNVKINTPLMNNQCLDFISTSNDGMILTNKSATQKTLADIISASAWTLFVAYYATAIGGPASPSYVAPGPIADTGGYWGLLMANIGGTHSIDAYNYDGVQNHLTIAASINASHVAMMRLQSGNVYLSVDGGSEVSMATGNTSNLGNAVVVGRSGFAHWDGRIGEIACYNTALTGTNLTDASSYFIGKWLAAPTNTKRSFATFLQ